MKTATLVGVVAALVVAGGAWYWFMQGEPHSDFDSTSYDLGEGAGAGQDIASAVSANIVGTWQSTADAQYVLKVEASGQAVESYGGEEVSTSTWQAFTNQNAPSDFPYPLEDNTGYVMMTMAGSPPAVRYFKVVLLTPKTLQLVYLDRGGELDFTNVQ